MHVNLQVGLLIIVVSIGFLALLALRAEKTNVRYTLVWLAVLFLMLIGLLLPGFLETFSQLLGFEVLSNMLFLFGYLALSAIVFSLTIIVSRQDYKLRLLIQEISILRNIVDAENKD